MRRKRKKAVLGIGETTVAAIQMGIQTAQMGLQLANQKKQIEQTEIAENRQLTNQRQLDFYNKYNNTAAADGYYDRVAINGLQTLKFGGKVKKSKRKCR